MRQSTEASCTNFILFFEVDPLILRSIHASRSCDFTAHAVFQRSRFISTAPCLLQSLVRCSPLVYKITDLSGRPLPETFSFSALFGSTVDFSGHCPSAMSSCLRDVHPCHLCHPGTLLGVPVFFFSTLQFTACVAMSRWSPFSRELSPSSFAAILISIGALVSVFLCLVVGTVETLSTMSTTSSFHGI